MKINFARLRLRLLETTLAFENEKMLPQSSEAYVEPHSPVEAFDIVPVLRQLRAEGLIDGTKMENENYLVTGITDVGKDVLKFSKEPDGGISRDELNRRIRIAFVQRNLEGEPES